MKIKRYRDEETSRYRDIERTGGKHMVYICIYMMAPAATLLRYWRALYYTCSHIV